MPKHLNFQTKNWEAVVAVEEGNLKQNLPVFLVNGPEQYIFGSGGGAADISDGKPLYTFGSVKDGKFSLFHVHVYVE